MGELRGRVVVLLGDWLFGASELIAVFPVVDQLISPAAFRWKPVVFSEFLAVAMLFLGVYLKTRRS
jgi:hypothetical protein